MQIQLIGPTIKESFKITGRSHFERKRILVSQSEKYNQLLTEMCVSFQSSFKIKSIFIVILNKLHAKFIK